MIVYGALNQDNKIVYIGQTTSTLEQRIQGHIDTAKYADNKYRFAQAIYDYGIDSFRFITLFCGNSIEELNRMEKFYIKYYDTISNGYNHRRGGDNFYHTEITKKKIGDAQRGDKNHMYGITGARNPNSIKVINLITGDTYHSVVECSKAEGNSISKIASVCRGEINGLNGNVYRYIDDDGFIIHIENEEIPKTKPVFNKTRNKLYKSMSEASIDMGFSKGYLSDVKLKHREYKKIHNEIVVTI